jgi:hypothetical protein
METFLNEGGDAATHLVLMCDGFWNSVKSTSNPMFRHFRSEQGSGIDVCSMKPIDLGVTFAGDVDLAPALLCFACRKKPVRKTHFVDG